MGINSKYNLAKTLLIAVFTITLFSCVQQVNVDAVIVPLPQNIQKQDGSFEIKTTTQIVVANEELTPLAHLLNIQLKVLTGFELHATHDKPNANYIFFEIEEGLEDEEYKLTVTENISIKASNYNSLALGLSSLVQLITLKNEGVFVSKVNITDQPEYEYRALMLDLARFWHPVETIQETIDLLWLYKVKYLVLHLSDNRRFTFPMDEYPDLKTVNADGTREYYTLEELNNLVEYAKQRGIAIIPEIDLPGHSKQLWSKYPETFGSIDAKTKMPKPLYVINIAKEKTYEASENIIKQLSEVFYTSPYIHLGGDEVYLEMIKQLPEYEDFCRKNGLEVALNGDVNELFCYFINRMNKAIKKTGKQTLVWEGFHNTGAGEETIAKDIKVIVWNASFNTPENLISNGYEVINSSWIPWYMVGAMNFAPSPEKGYNWNVTEWSHWNNIYQDRTVTPSSLIKGGQLSFWEQNYFQVIPIIRERLPILSERLWHTSSTSTYKAFKQRATAKDSLYTQLFKHIAIKTENLLSEQDATFKEVAIVDLDTYTAGDIKYIYSENWGIPNMDSASVYTKPISLNKSGILTTQLFDENGNKLGFPVQRYYQKITPAYTYKVFGTTPNKGWDSLPNFSELNLIREGVSGKMTPARLDKINGDLFKKIKREGHIETRFNGLYNPYALELKGVLYSNDNTYTLKLHTDDGLAELYVDGQLVVKGQELGDKPEEFTFSLNEGLHKFKINYYYRQIQNQLNIMYKTPEMQDFEPFEQLVEPLNE